MPAREAVAMERQPVVQVEHTARRDSASGARLGDPLLRLQSAVGNRVVTQLLAAGQPKLDVGRAGDRLEEEADEVARQVAEMAGAPARLNDELEAAMVSRRIQRRVLPEVGPEGGTLSPEVEDAIQAARSGGRPLAPGLRHEMEGAFGADFGGVRLHSGPGAADLNRSLQSTAFTVGRDIFFGSGLPDAGDRAGRQLLAHELTHTIQQGAAPLLTEEPESLA